MAAIAADRNLLFGLLALQNGLINQAQLVAAFQAWTLDRARALADHFIALGHLNEVQRAVVEAMADLHVAKHGDIERSLATVSAGRSTRESLAQIGDAQIHATLARLGSALTDRDQDADADSDRTASYAVGSATSDGQRFRVLRPHARGGLGAVFVALDEELHREVALKQILHQHADDPTSRQRFVLEAEITGGLEHPGIVPVYGLGTYADGRPYYAMRFIRGDSLKEAIDRFHGEPDRANAGSGRDGAPGRVSAGRGSRRKPRSPDATPLALRKLLRRFLDVCNAIDYAHSRGVLHRDIKPGNIIVGKHGETLVVDWGLAKALGRSDPGSGERTLVPSSASGSAETLPGSALGTPAYMSPEQASGDLDRLGACSDVYSLGATLYYLLTGKPPLEGDDVGEVLRKVQRGEFPPPRQIDTSIDPALEAVCKKAMSTNPDERYASCRALAEDVERWMADEPVSAWHEPWTRTLMRWLTRHRVRVTAAGAAGLVALVGAAVVLGVQTRANAALKAANADLAVANTKVSRANADLAAANERERARFALAQEAIRTFHTGVSDDVLLKQEEFKALRATLLRGARVFYQKLEGLLQGHEDRDSRLALGRAYLEVSELTRQLDSVEEANVVLRRALDLFKGLSRENPADEESQRALALGERALGIIKHMVGQEDEGFAAEQRSRELFRTLATAHPADPELRRDWAESERHIAASLYIRNRPTEAIEAIERARGILASSDKPGPRSDGWEAELLETYGTRAMILGDSGRSVEALAAYEQAREFGEKLFRARPEDPRTSHELARTLGNRGGFLIALGRQADALASYERALEVLKAAGGANPTIFLFPAASAWIEFARAGELVELGRDAEALEGLLRARTAREILVRANPTVVRNRVQLVGVNYQISGIHRRAGRMAQALESLERARDQAASLVDSHPAEPEYQRHLVTTYMELGDLHAALRHPDRVLSYFDQAVRIARQLDEADPATASRRTNGAQTLRRRGRAWQKCGRPDQAASDFRESIAMLRGLKTPTTTDYYGIACGLSLLHGVARESGSGVSAADGDAAAREAIDSLQQAASGGGRYVAVLRQDPELAPIRSRPDFQLFALDMAFPEQPFAAATP
jgi:serine/threonine-protein kinase